MRGSKIRLNHEISPCTYGNSCEPPMNHGTSLVDDAAVCVNCMHVRQPYVFCNDCNKRFDAIFVEMSQPPPTVICFECSKKHWKHAIDMEYKDLDEKREKKKVKIDEKYEYKKTVIAKLVKRLKAVVEPNILN